MIFGAFGSWLLSLLIAAFGGSSPADGVDPAALQSGVATSPVPGDGGTGATDGTTRLDGIGTSPSRK